MGNKSVVQEQTLNAIVGSITKEFEVSLNKLSNIELDKQLEKQYNNVVWIVIEELTEELFQLIAPEDTFLKRHQLSSLSNTMTISNEQIKQLTEKINVETSHKSYCFLPTGLGAYDSRQSLYTRIIRQTSIDEKKLIYAYINKMTVEEARKMNKELEKLVENLNNSILIITGTSSLNKPTPVIVISKKELPHHWEIRPANRKEYFTFHRLADQFQKIYRTSRKDLFPTGVTYLQTEFYSLCDHVNDTLLLMYEQDSNVIGFIEGQLTTTYGVREFNDHRIMTIKRIFVAPEYRRQQIGTRLFESICQYANKRKCDRLEIKIYHFSEEAIKFLQSKDMSVLSFQYEKKIGKK